MHTDAGALAHRIQAVDHLVVPAIGLNHHLAVDIGGNAAHLVVDCGHHRYRFLGDVDIGKVMPDLKHRGQSLHDGVYAQMVELEQHMVFIWTAAPPFLDFLVHGTRDEVARRQIFECGRVAFHETLAQAVEQNCALPAAALGEQHARTGNPRGVELPELHILQWNTGPCGQAKSVTRVDVRVGGRGKDAPGPARGQQCGFCLQDVKVPGFHLQRGHSQDVAIGVPDQVERHPFDKKTGSGLDVLLVERVQHRMASAVRCCAGSLNRFFAIVRRMPTKRPLVDGSVRVTVKRHAHVLEVINHLGRFTAHEFDRILIA